MSTKTNQKSPLRDLNSDMGLTNRTLQSQLVVPDAPYIYEVRDEDGNRFRHCGSMKDVETVLSSYPNYSFQKIYLPEPPKTVDVPYIRVSPDLELPMQQILPESQQEPLNLEL